ncbi:hypothetical protein SAMN05216326_1452 [Nitrosomonas marina]|uniref:Uncharacterized protein n=1 Tax=Nitrosomonas marina TaxID=917 RepID=A0A1I0FTS5_9PROT|nr:hypothetical protein SAMN05216326_1452 [Nitrosomonas marina]
MWSVTGTGFNSCQFLQSEMLEHIAIFFGRKKDPKNDQQPFFQIPCASSHQQVNAITHCAFQIIEVDAVT